MFTLDLHGMKVTSICIKTELKTAKYLYIFECLY